MVKQKNNGLLQGDKVDTMNLLDSTDSDVEWLNLPPLKGKKPPKRKRAVKTKDLGCNLCCFVRPLVCLALLGAVILLIITTVWLTAQISDLRAQLKKVETKTSGSLDDIQKLFSQLSAYNKSLTAESQRLSQVQANITAINTTIFKLTEDVGRLGEGMKAAPELKQLPEKLQTVSKTLADLGSDVTGMKDTVTGLGTSLKAANTKLEEVNIHLNALKQSDNKGEDTDNEMSPELSNMIQMVQQKLQDMNSTLSTQVSVVMKSLSQHEERFTHLDNVTDTLRRNLSVLTTDHTSISSDHANMADQYTSDQFKTSVAQVVNTVLSQKNTSAGEVLPPPSSSTPSPSIPSSLWMSVKDTLDVIQERYGNMSSTVLKNSEAIKDIKTNFVPLPDFNTATTNLQTTMEGLNSTLLKLKAQIDMKAGLVTAAPDVPTKTNISQTTGSTASPPANKQDNSSTSKVPTTKTEQVVTSTEAPGSEQPVTKVTKQTASTESGDSHLTFPGIHTADDLDLNFRRWDRWGAGQVTYDAIHDRLGPQMPQESELKPYDKDNNDMYDIQEIADALGITLEESMLPDHHTHEEDTGHI